MSIHAKFGDYRIGTASPNDFLSLIKYADCVFTDSFHCNAFSILFNRPFFVFARHGMTKMESRIVSLLQLFGCSERFCDVEERKTNKYLNSIPNNPYSFEKYNEMRNKSLHFLKSNIDV